jgi:hypothetical protein
MQDRKSIHSANSVENIRKRSLIRKTVPIHFQFNANHQISKCSFFFSVQINELSKRQKVKLERNIK